MNDSSIHSSLSQQSETPVQVFHTKIAISPIIQTVFEILLPDTMFNISQAAVFMIIAHYLNCYINDFVGLTDILTPAIAINLVTILISDSVVEAGIHYISKSLITKKLNESQTYFIYTIIFGALSSVIVSFVILVGVQKQLTSFILWRLQNIQKKKVYQILVTMFIFAHFASLLQKFMKVEGQSNLALNYFGLILQLYSVTTTIFFAQIKKQVITSLNFVPCIATPLIVSAIYSLFKVFHLFPKQIKYNNILFVGKSTFKSMHPKIIAKISKLSLYNIYQNVGDALIKLFTAQLLTYSDIPVVIFTLLQLELTNALNKSISNNMASAFRINIQLRRYDRVFQFFVSSFVISIVNFAYQILTFSFRNIIYKLIYNQFDSTLHLFHGSVDGLLGIFSAFSTAVMRSNPNTYMGLFTGSFKLVLAVGFWLTAKYTNSGNSHYSAMLYRYKYCTDIVGLGLFVLYFQKFYTLKKRNSTQEEMKESKLIPQELQVIETVSIQQSESKETLQESKTNEILVSQSQTHEESKIKEE
ncbi:Hypothetical_protein [Hexamita inflata]|uniref:Hypothetical_protein n=1 Tax=Hexamita inflata TaxID=28002 RepID=A0AA86TU63_9EUKA|nr:Hypothetical protein HINF_LOCUS16305 [Hexamita inflata]